MNEIVQMGFSSENLKILVAEILQSAAREGASSAEVDVSVNKGFNVTVRKGDVETVEYNQDKMIGITVYFGKRSGASSLSDIRPEAIHAAVKAACNIARFTDEDTFSGLADKELLAFNYPEIDLAHPWDISVDEAIELAKECEAIALKKINALLIQKVQRLLLCKLVMHMVTHKDSLAYSLQPAMKLAVF